MCLKGQLGEESPSAKLFAAAMEDSSVEAVWKMYSAARASLPYKERMDNLTWRMLGMRLRRRQQEQVAVKVERDVEMEYGFEEPFGSSTEGVEVYDLRPSVNPLNTVLMNAPEFQESSGPHQFGSFSNHAQSAGFLSSADVHNQFNLFDATFSDQMNDQLTMDFSKSSPAIVSETSDSNARDRMSMMASDVLAGQSAGSLFRDSTAVTPTFPDQSNFLDHFFPSSIIGDAGDSAPVPPTPTATAKPKKLRQNSTATQVRRGSGVKKRPVPLRNPSTTSLTSLGNDPATASASQESSKDSSKDTRCSNCHTKTTPLWRRDPAGNPLCNACGLFLKLHGVVRPLSLKTDVIKKRQRNNNTSKQSKSSSPNLEDPKQTRKTLTSLGARKRSSANVRETSSSSPVTLASSLSRVNSNLEASEPSRRPATAAATHINDTHNFNDNNNTDTNNDDNNANNGHFDFFPPADLSLTDDTEASSQLNDTGIAGGGERSHRADKTPPQQKGANGNTNWEWLSLSL